VVGLSQAAAETAITDAGLVVGTVTTQNSDTVPAGAVISQNPTALTEVAPGSAVDLVVSDGPALVPVPDVVGLSQAAAGTAITNAGLVVGTVTSQNSSTVSAGDVISQNPTAATGVAPGSAVDLWVSDGPAPPAGTGTVTGTVSDSSNGNPLKRAVVQTNTGQSARTNKHGRYTMTDVPATAMVTASKDGYGPQTKPADLAAAVDFALNPASGGTGGTGSIKGTVWQAGARVRDALVQADTVSTNSNRRGKYTLNGVTDGPQTLTASNGGCGDSRPVTVIAGQTVSQDLFLTCPP
jgi:hypothetical protein